jgi:hypothetical protein
MNAEEHRPSLDVVEEEKMSDNVVDTETPDFETLDTHDVPYLLNLIKEQQEAYRMLYSRNVILFSELTEANLLLEKLMASHPPADPCPEGPAA